MTMLHFWKPFAASATAWWRNNHQASSIWRLTRLYTGLLLLVVAILLWVLFELSVGQLTRSQHQQLIQLAQQQELLAQELEHDDFIRQFNLQAEQSKQYIMEYSELENSYGRLGSIPKKLSTCPTLKRFPIYNYNEIRLYSGCIVHIDSARLLVATDDEALFDLQEHFIQASIAALLLALALGLITGWFFSAQVVRRINTINHIAQKVEAGELKARIPVSKKNDEFDHMANHINTMLKQLEHSFQAIAGVTDAIAHDLRTPLGRLRLRIEDCLINDNSPQQISDNLAAMLAELDDILATFTAMLELTRLEQGQQNSQLKPLLLSPIATDAIELLQPLAQQSGQSINLINKKELQLTADATLIFRAIYNLLENACKYAGNNKKISLEITNHGFIVCDNGSGIPCTESDKVFQRLYRLEQSRNSQGYGLGLAIVKAIVHLHGGSIKLEDNQPGLKVIVAFL